MKQIIQICALSLAGTMCVGQGMISDIMVVETVSIDLSEVHQKIVAKYNETLKKETAIMNEDIVKIDKEYTEEVAKYTADFSKELKDGEEQVVTNLKKITVTRVTSLTKTHRKDKKNTVQHFLNKMQLANRRLPLFLRNDAAAEVESKGSKLFETFENDYQAHMETIKNFEEQEHLIVTEGDSADMLE